VPRSSRGYDAAKKVNGRKRHLAVDTLGLLLAIVVTAASVQDRDGARPLLWRLRLGGRGILLVWADAAYAGRLIAWARAALHLRVRLVRRRLAHAFEVLPRRWVIERTLFRPGSAGIAAPSVTMNGCPPIIRPWCSGR
jgi:transposase